MSISYIIFCRIVGLKELRTMNCRQPSAFSADVVKKPCAAAGQAESARIYSSVYGRLLVSHATSGPSWIL